MDKNEEKQEIENPEIELSEEELDEASGGIINVGGSPASKASIFSQTIILNKAKITPEDLNWDLNQNRRK